MKLNAYTKTVPAQAVSQPTMITNNLLEGEIYPEDPARLVLFLASDQSKMITKQVINVDGGWV